MELCGGRLKKLRKIARKNLLLILIISGVISGFIIGLPLNKHVQSDRYDDEERREIVMLVSFLGDIFVRLLKLLIVPLIIASIVLAVAKLDPKTTGKLGRRTVIYYLGTTLTAVIIGVILVVSIRPGDTAVEHEKKESRHVNALDSILDLLRCVGIVQCGMYECMLLYVLYLLYIMYVYIRFVCIFMHVCFNFQSQY